MNVALSRCIESVLKDDSVSAVYLYGSYVNGYYREDSDIDVVALTSRNSRDKPIEMPPNISIHAVHPLTFELFEVGHPYAHLRIVPIHNEQKCAEISDKIKSELVRRELVRMRKAGIEEFDILHPLHNYLLAYGVQRPWRIKPIKRIFESKEAHQILEMEYGRILSLLKKRGMVVKRGKKWSVNADYVFDEEVLPLKDNVLFKVKNSYCGWQYVRNALSIIDFTRRRI